MYTVDLYLRVRLACHVDGLSQREAASRFGIARETVRKMLRHSEPPGYRRRQPPKRPKLAPFTDIIDRILEEDRPVHRKQHHTAKRIFERLRDEHGFTGKERAQSLCGRDALDDDLSFQVTRLGKVKGHLHAKPCFGGRTESL